MFLFLLPTELPTFPAGAFAVLAVVFAAGLAVYFWYNTIPGMLYVVTCYL